MFLAHGSASVQVGGYDPLVVNAADLSLTEECVDRFDVKRAHYRIEFGKDYEGEDASIEWTVSMNEMDEKPVVECVSACVNILSDYIFFEPNNCSDVRN